MQKKKTKLFLTVFVLLLLLAGITVGVLFIAEKGEANQSSGEREATAISAEEKEEKLAFDPIIYGGNDGNLYLKNALDPDAEPILLGDDASGTYTYELYSYLKNDNTAVLFPANVDMDSAYWEVADLYIYEIGSERPKRIAKKAFQYLPSEDFSYVYFCNMKENSDESYSLYVYHNGKTEKVTDDVEYYHISKKGDKVVCLCRNGEIVSKEYGKKATVPVKKADSVRYASEDMSEIIYVADGEYIKRFRDGTEFKITCEYEGEYSSNSEYIEDGEGYFIEYDSTVTLGDVILDDMADEDEGKDSDAVYVRNRIREAMDLDYCSCSIYDLYYFDGEKNIYVGKITNLGTIWFEESSALATVSTIGSNKFTKVKMSELCRAFTAGQMKSEGFVETQIFDEVLKYQERKSYMLSRGSILFEFDANADPYGLFSYDEESRKFLYSKNRSGDGYGFGDVYILSPYEENPEESLVTVTDAYHVYSPQIYSGSIYYGKAREGTDNFDLCKDGEVILENVYWYRNDDYVGRRAWLRTGGEGEQISYYIFEEGKITPVNITSQPENIYVVFTENGNYVIQDTSDGANGFYIQQGEGDACKVSATEYSVPMYSDDRTSRGFYAAYLAMW